MKSYVVLLRGVNITGKNRMPMAELRKTLLETGFPDVKTYIQSGNVILKSKLSREALQQLIHDLIKEKVGTDVTVIARTHDEIAEVFANNPFPIEAKKRTYFTFLESVPEDDLIEAVFDSDFSPDEVIFNQDSIYILFATKYSDSKFNNNFFERKLKVGATTRNFNTVSKLLELSADS